MTEISESEFTANMSEKELKQHKRHKALFIVFFVSILSYLLLDLTNGLLNPAVIERPKPSASFDIPLPAPVPNEVWKGMLEATPKEQGTPNDEQ